MGKKSWIRKLLLCLVVLGLFLGSLECGKKSKKTNAGSSSTDIIPAPPDLPTTPGILSITVDSFQINLSWIDRSDNEDGFKIERKIDVGGTYTQIIAVGASTNMGVVSYFDIGPFLPSTTYYYRVRAYNVGGDSGYTNENFGTTPSVPAVPTSLIVAVDSFRVNFSWYDNSNNEGYFKIERKAGADGTYAQIATVGAGFGTGIVSYFDIGPFLPSTTYYYRVKAYNAGGDSGYSNEGYGVIPSLPNAPTVLNVAVISPTQINLNWTDNSDNETGFKIERKTGAGGTYAQITTVGVGINSYSNMEPFLPDTTYYYQVKAYNIAGDSDPSNEGYVILPSLPNAPTVLNVAVISTTQINLSWTDNSDNETGFKIERKAGSGETYAQIGTVGAGTGMGIISYSDTGSISPSTYYYYQVKAYNLAGDSGFSNEAGVLSLGNWVTISAGDYHNIGTKRNGSIWAWGDNGQGQLGLGDIVTPRKTPTQIASDLGWVTTGGFHTISVKTDGSIWGWGYNRYGQLGVALGDTVNKATPTQTGSDTDWSTLAAGYFYSLGIKTTGSLWAWGYNNYGQLGLNDTMSRTIPTKVGTDEDWSAVSGSSGTLKNSLYYHHSIGKKNNGNIWGWGHNKYGQLGLGDTIFNRTTPTLISSATDWTMINAGLCYTIAKKTNNTLWAWGANYYGQLGLGYTTISTTGITVPTLVGNDSDWATFATGDAWMNGVDIPIGQTVALKTTGTLWVWGSNYCNLLGLGDTNINVTTPMQFGTESDWSAVAAGYAYFLACKTNGTLWAWGYNNYGQLGLGDTMDRVVPALIRE